MRKYFIYKITNQINQKVYIGQTLNLKSRISQYKGLKISERQRHIYRSISKYGWESFTVEILFEGLCTKQFIDKLEEYYIKVHKEKNLSMNISSKASGTMILKGKNNPLSKPIYQLDLEGNLLNEWECISQIKEVFKTIEPSMISYACTSNTHIAYGYLWAHVKNFNKDSVLFNYQNRVKAGEKIQKPIVQLNSNMELIKKFDSITKAALFYNISLSNIVNCLIKRNTYCNGFIWLYEDEYLSNNFFIKEKLNTGKQIVSKNILTGEYIEFNSIKEASEKLNVNRINITKILKKKTKNPRKYDFKYKTST